MLNLYPFLTYVIVTTFTPGPNNILSMTNGLRYDYWHTLRFLAGETAGFFIVMLISGLLFITPIFQNPFIITLFAMVLACVGFTAVSSWALGGNIFRSFLRKYEKWFNLVMGGLLIYTAVASFISSHG